MQPTEEQAKIIAQAKSSNESILIEALAGAAKTTTLVMLAHAMPVVTTISVAFNKKIAEEMAKRMPSYVQCMTLNSLGHRAWAKVTGKKLILNTDKNYENLKLVIETLPKDDQGYAQSIFSSVLRAIGLAKSAGYAPKKWHSVGKSLIDAEELALGLETQIDDTVDDFMLDLIDKVLERSIEQAYAGTIDFDDQIYMSTLFGAPFPKFERGMVDEAQDLNRLNHEMIDKLKLNQLIAVGDPYQSIYAFRGAIQSSMKKLEERYHMKKMTLSLTFRVPKNGVIRAQSRVPHFRAHETNRDGQVITLDEWNAGHIPDGAMILCRANAPLFSLAIKLIKQSRGVQLVGRELGPGLIKVMKKLGPLTMDKAGMTDAIAAWEKEKLKKSRETGKSSVMERADCLRVFAEYGNTLDEAIAYAEHLFASAGPVKLMTGHKAKGLENDVVFILDPWRIPSKYARDQDAAGVTGPLEQELNLKYVMETRFKDTMYFVDLEKMR